MDIAFWSSTAIGLLVFLIVLAKAIGVLRRGKLERRNAELTGHGRAMTVERFLRHRRAVMASNVQPEDFPGCYIIHNHSKDRYYVGQSVHVLRRVANHFTGKGNGDVYADLKYGDEFTVRLEALLGSGYLNLDDLERALIAKYDAYDNGYNKTRGNGD